jgi:CO/xanthine dehydrogenase Mo-binding subunit
MWYGIGNTAMANPAGAILHLQVDGTAILLAGCADIGQGSDTVLAQIVAEELGIPLEGVEVISADTGVTPDGGATSASRQTYISGNAALHAAKAIKSKILEIVAIEWQTTTGSIVFKEGAIHYPEKNLVMTTAQAAKLCKSKGVILLGEYCFNPVTTTMDELGQGSPYAAYAYATQVALVEVNTLTGQVKVLELIAAHDVGQVINPLQTEGQIEGGALMGIGYSILEELKVEKGKVLSDSFHTYLLPTSLDMPKIYPIIVEEPVSTGPFGAKGVGEPAMIPTAAAVANAIYDAVGIRVQELPITPELILRELAKKEEERR